MKRFILILTIALFFVCNICYGQTGKEVVQDFAENMQMWTMTVDISYRKKIEEICDIRGCRINDNFSKLIAQRVFKKKDIELATYNLTMDTYLNAIAWQLPNINFTYSNFESVKNAAELAKPKSTHEVEFVACNVAIRGSLNLSMKEIFIVRNGKITKFFSINKKDYKKGKKIKS